jgi:hypothetical protein
MAGVAPLPSCESGFADLEGAEVDMQNRVEEGRSVATTELRQ